MATEEQPPTEAQRLAEAHRLTREELRTRLPTDEEEQALYLRFLEKQRQLEAQRKLEAQQRDEQLTRDIEAKVARSLGAAADDGTGRCQWCGIVLGTDAEGHRTHIPTRSCPGPKPLACGICGSGDYRWVGAPTFDWQHRCRQARDRREHQLEPVRPAPGPLHAHPEHRALPAPAEAIAPLDEVPDPFGVRGPHQRGEW